MLYEIEFMRASDVDLGDSNYRALVLSVYKPSGDRLVIECIVLLS